MAPPDGTERTIDLAGRTAVVTGGSKGIGLGLARGLAAAGAAVSIWARDEATARAAADEIGAHAAVCDVRQRGDIDRALAETVAALGPVDVLVTSAGRSSALEPFLEMSDESWHDVLDTNLGGVFRTCQVLGRHMAEHGRGGKMVLLSSLRVIMGAPVSADYAASKGGVESMLRCVAMAMAPHGVQVNAIRPGWIRTAMTEGMWADPAFAAGPPAPIPAARWGDPVDLAGVVTYLASSASDYHTGDVITVDGGLTAAAGGGTTGATTAAEPAAAGGSR
ncbi:MAG TPA: SDR family oxidoreductase [Iamia sp.]|nr:SDR family oxidoreductase [Iamia sp.]